MEDDQKKAGKWNLYYYNSRLRPFAHRLRNHSTLPEILVWKHLLRARKMRGYPFRRQRPVLNYITDFLSFDLKLVIEIDGFHHFTPEGRAYDQQRDEDLAAIGFTTLRFSNAQVYHRLDEVKAAIEDWIDEHAPAPPPPPHKRGDRRKRRRRK